MSTPLLHALIALVAGILWSPFHSFHSCKTFITLAALLWLAIWLLSLALALRRPLFELILSSTTTLGAFLLGILLGIPYPLSTDLPQRSPAFLQAIVLEPPEWRETPFASTGTQVFTATFLSQTSHIHWKEHPPTSLAVRIRCTLISTLPIPLQRGDIFAVSGSWSRIPKATNPGQFDPAAYFARQGIAYRFTARRGPLLWASPPLSPRVRFARALDRLRQTASAAITAPPSLRNEALVLRGMLLGLREPIPDDIADALQRTGTLHIIAISGLHIGILCALWWGIMWILNIPGRWRGACLLPLLWLYACLVGLRPSVLRASLMFSGLALAPLASRPHRAAHTLVAVAFLYLLCFPHDLTSLGTLLTFLSVAALVAFVPLADAILARLNWLQPPLPYDFDKPLRHLRFLLLRYFLQLFIATFAIWIVTWPITLSRSHLITPSAWLANLFVIPLLSLVLAGAFGTLLLAPLSSFAASLLLLPTLWLLRFLLSAIGFLASLPAAFFALPTLTPPALFCYYAAVSLAWYWLYLNAYVTSQPALRRRLSGLGAFLALLLCTNFIDLHGPYHGKFSITALDVGLGDAFVIRSPAGHTLLVDAGPRFAQASAGSRIVVPFLRAMGINRLDAVFLSHFDIDHSGGLPEIIETMPVRAIFSPPLPPHDLFARELHAHATRRRIPWHFVHAGFHTNYGPLSAEILAPSRFVLDLPSNAVPWGDNFFSLVIRFECHDHAALFTGDATAATEALLLQRPHLLPAAILKLGHHGSASSTHPRFLTAVAPRLAILSVGHNRLGLPSPSVLATLAHRHVPVSRTDHLGAFSLVLHKHFLHLDQFSN